jgi:hypothetical protein
MFEPAISSAWLRWYSIPLRGLCRPCAADNWQAGRCLLRPEVARKGSGRCRCRRHHPCRWRCRWRPSRDVRVGVPRVPQRLSCDGRRRACDPADSAPNRAGLADNAPALTAASPRGILAGHGDGSSPITDHPHPWLQNPSRGAPANSYLPLAPGTSSQSPSLARDFGARPAHSNGPRAAGRDHPVSLCDWGSFADSQGVPVQVVDDLSGV